LLEAAECGMQHGCGWYVFASEDGVPRQLNDAEEEIVNRFRFGKDNPSARRQMKLNR
jgi:hypothetical protein